MFRQEYTRGKYKGKNIRNKEWNEEGTKPSRLANATRRVHLQLLLLTLIKNLGTKATPQLVLLTLIGN